MAQFQSSITIAAPPQRVWDVLTNIDLITNGDFGVTAIEGTLDQGQKIKVFSEIAPGQGFPVKVMTMQAPRTMVWKGGLPLGLFTGVRIFDLDPVESGTAFSMSERFSGLMAPIIAKSMPNLQPTFDKFTAALKAHAEG